MLQNDLFYLYYSYIDNIEHIILHDQLQYDELISFVEKFKFMPFWCKAFWKKCC